MLTVRMINIHGIYRQTDLHIQPQTPTQTDRQSKFIIKFDILWLRNYVLNTNAGKYTEEIYSVTWCRMRISATTLHYYIDVLITT